MNHTDRTLIRLAACALREEIPDGAFLGEIDWSSLRNKAQSQKMTAMIGFLLLGAQPSENFTATEKAYWADAYHASLRRSLLYETDRGEIFRRLDRLGVWYAPLKGILLEQMYPERGMREMADNDILFDQERQKEVCSVMQEMGYCFSEETVHLSFTKEPFYHFEFHKTLFSERLPSLTAYYGDPRSRMIPAERTGCEFRFSAGDLYVYLVAHSFKHFSGGGIGLRSLADDYVFRHFAERLYPGEMPDESYIDGELEKIGCLACGQALRRISEYLFGESCHSPEGLTEEDREMLDVFCLSGMYGTVERLTERRLRRTVPEGEKVTFGKKIAFLFRRIFPPVSAIRYRYPAADRHPVLIPIYYVVRIFDGLFRRRKRVRSELKTVIRSK